MYFVTYFVILSPKTPFSSQLLLVVAFFFSNSCSQCNFVPFFESFKLPKTKKLI